MGGEKLVQGDLVEHIKASNYSGLAVVSSLMSHRTQAQFPELRQVEPAHHHLQLSLQRNQSLWPPWTPTFMFT